MRTIILLLLFCVPSAFACHCLTLKEAKLQAIQDNKFILVHFKSSFIFETDGELQASQAPSEIKEILGHFIYVCMPPLRENTRYYKQYDVGREPQVLIVDANGREIYRLQYDNLPEIADALTDFTLPDDFLGRQLRDYRQKQHYATALRVAQRYLDYSLLVDDKFKKNITDVSKGYIEEAEKMLSRKDKAFDEKAQKIQLMKIMHWAYEKNFAVLDEQLASLNSDSISAGNKELYYFLKYITAKALQKAEFQTIETAARSIEGFESLAQKADIILTKQI